MPRRSVAPMIWPSFFIEILQRPENELLMSISEDYRQIQEERDIIDRSLPALLPGKVRDPLPLHPDCSVLVKELRCWCYE